MVQNYLGSMRRVIHRFNNLLGDNRRSGLTPNSSVHRRHHEQPKQQSAPTGEEPHQQLGEPVVSQLEGVTQKFKQFSEEFPKALERQSSPLIDRIPPRGVELWRDFWDTVRKQFRRINQEFLQVSRDMGRLLTGRQPSNGASRVVVVRPRENEQQGGAQAATPLASLLYSYSSMSNEQAVAKQFQEFYDNLSAQLKLEQHKMDELSKASGEHEQQQQQQQKESQVQGDNNNKAGYELIEEMDDEQTRQVLTQNPALRQQISQDINVFSSIFDIIRTFLSRLRGSAEDIRNILERPGAMRDNNSVTPGPAVKPTVDQLLKDTIDSQRNINSQSKPTGR